LAAEVVKTRFSKDDPHVRCVPDKPPRGMPHLTKVVHTPKLLLYEVNAMYRQILIDVRGRRIRISSMVHCVA
jgi:hypothetical protein